MSTYGLAGATAANERQPTAAQEALARVESLGNELSDILRRVETIAEHLGVSAPPTTGADPKAPRPVRSGIIGAIHENTDAAHSFVQSIGATLARIERQV